MATYWPRRGKKSVEHPSLEELLERAKVSGLVMGSRWMFQALKAVAIILKRLDERIAALERRGDEDVH